MAFKMKGSPLQRNFNIGAKSPLEQVVTQASEDVENNAESVDSWSEEKKKLANMSARDRRRAVRELRDKLRVGNQPKQKTYWDKTTKTMKKIPGLFSSKKAKEDFILKQTMKNRGSAHTRDVGRATMEAAEARRTELDNE